MTRPDIARKDIYQSITDAIIAQFETGVAPWLKPWSGGSAMSLPKRVNGEHYKGINVLLLWSAAHEHGYSSAFWMTFRQASELGAQVRRGEKSTTIVYANAITREEQDKDGNDIERVIPFLKTYAVFNAAQIDGLPERFQAEPLTFTMPEQRLEAVDAFFAKTGADIREGGTEAFYASDSDHIQMPPFASFRTAHDFATTLCHEAVHWTKKESRLNRDFVREKWGDAGYAREELVAEIGSAFLAADFGLEFEPRPDHASYIAHWLTILKNDKRAIFQAASFAQKAVQYLHDFGIEPDIEADQNAT
jgi:antirestriction protein ArdC